MAEFMTEDQAKDKFASKGKGNTALGLSIGALGAWLLNGASGNGFLGMGGNCNSNCDYPTAYQVAQKECADNLALTNSIWQTRVTDLNEKFDLYTRLDSKIRDLDKGQATLQAQLPLMFQLANVTSERYTDDKCCDMKTKQNAINFAMQSEICKKVDGVLGLPFSSLITGVPTLPPLVYNVSGCNGSTPA